MFIMMMMMMVKTNTKILRMMLMVENEIDYELKKHGHDGWTPWSSIVLPACHCRRCRILILMVIKIIKMMMVTLTKNKMMMKAEC